MERNGYFIRAHCPLALSAKITTILITDLVTRDGISYANTVKLEKKKLFANENPSSDCHVNLYKKNKVEVMSSSSRPSPSIIVKRRPSISSNGKSNQSVTVELPVNNESENVFNVSQSRKQLRSERKWPLKSSGSACHQQILQLSHR